MEGLDRWERVCLALLLAGLGVRVFHLGGSALEADSSWYVTMAKTLADDGAFLVPWVGVETHTHHFPPLFPAFLSLFLQTLGASMLAVKAANLTAAVLFVAVTFFTTRDLYGRRAAFAVTAVAATLPTLVSFDWGGLSETFVAMLFALTIWAILKSLERPPYIVLAGIFAGLGYLAKASMGPFFLLAGGAGFLWRFAYVRWGVFRDKWYLLGGTLFALCVVPWAWRNLTLHGSWETQPAASRALDTLFDIPSWPLRVGLTALWAFVLVAMQCLAFLPGLRTALPDIRAERTTGLLLAILTPVLVASFFVAGFSAVEGYNIVFAREQHPMRYAITPIVPMLWLSMRWLDWTPPHPEGTPTGGTTRMRYERVFIALGAGVLLLTLAFRYPFGLADQSARDAVYLLAGTALGIALLAVSRFFAWQPTTRRTAEGDTQWRATPRKLPLYGLALGILLFVLALLQQEIHLPLFLAAAAAALVATWRYRAVVVAVVFLGWIVGGSYWAWPEEDMGNALGQMEPDGTTVAVMPGWEPWFYPFLPDNVHMTPWEGNATYRIQPRGFDAPPDADLVQTFGRYNDYAPAAWLRIKVPLMLRGETEGGPWQTFALYRTNVTTA